MKIDHFAYLVRDTDRAIDALAPVDSEVSMYRHRLESQQAYITFVTPQSESPMIELVEPFPENKAMQSKLKREGVPSVLYHIGYRVPDFDKSFGDMRAKGWLPLTMPFEGFDVGCRASHLYNPDLGIIEIMEMVN